MELERRGIPTVTVLSRVFAPVGQSLAESHGLPSLRVAVIEHPVGAATRAEVERKAEATVGPVAEVLSRPTSGGTLSRTVPAQEETLEMPPSAEEANELFFARGWTDGLPVIPPSVPLVERMVAASGREAEELVATLPPRRGAATVRKIAANAAMAGCLPEYMPVVLAAVEAVADPSYGGTDRALATHAAGPLIIVNGPIVERLGLNSGTGVFGPGWRANATIGRALRLAMMNLGGAIPGVTDMAQHGHPAKFTYCIAENEAASPWEPLHVERGFSPEQSVVTMVNAEAPHSVNDNVSTSARAILTTCASVLATLGNNNLYSQGEPVLALGPQHAAYIAAEGWSKRDVKLCIFEKARQPWRLVRGRGKALGPNFPKWLERAEDEDMVPILCWPDELIVVVCGGAGTKSMAIPTGGRVSRSVSRLIREPAAQHDSPSSS